ncbi:MAG: ABC transporter substrate-binding protein [Spirochaetales bacterium]|nr:ABC transporter substrate-binding protein [Spirochaetales bacterium]
MKLHCEVLDTILDLEIPPKRIVSLSSGFTEALFELGASDSVVGVSEYCYRYCDCAHLPRAGWYLNGDFEVLDRLKPDLVLMTSGVQLRFARLLARQGLPVYVLPLPTSLGGILENIVRLGGLVGRLPEARNLANTMMSELLDIRSRWSGTNPRIYAETWFGVHARRIGGLSYIQDLLWYAGADPIYGQEAWSYLPLDLEGTTKAKPEVFVGFYEPEHPMDFPFESERRGWKTDFGPGVITSDTKKGRNIIHDGPSLVQTARWLQAELVEVLRKTPGLGSVVEGLGPVDPIIDSLFKNMG